MRYSKFAQSDNLLAKDGHCLFVFCFVFVCFCFWFFGFFLEGEGVIIRKYTHEKCLTFISMCVLLSRGILGNRPIAKLDMVL